MYYNPAQWAKTNPFSPKLFFFCQIIYPSNHHETRKGWGVWPLKSHVTTWPHCQALDTGLVLWWSGSSVGPHNSMKRQRSLILFAAREVPFWILTTESCKTQNKQSQQEDPPYGCTGNRNSSIGIPLSSGTRRTRRTSLNAAPPGHPAPSQGSKTERGGGGGKSQEVVRKSKGQCKRKPKTPGKKKLEKPKKVQGKLFCVSLFLAKCEKNQHKRERQSQWRDKDSTELQIQANYLTLLLCGAAGSAQEPNHDFSSQPFFHFFFFLFSYKVHCNSVLL